MAAVSSLYTYQGQKITDTDFFAALVSLGVEEGDTLFIHSDTKPFGRLAISSGEELLAALVDVFERSVSERGIIIMPTFSYSFGADKDNVFDVAKTKSTVGSLTEYFRQLPGVVRTREPMMSVAVRGADIEKMVDIGNDTLGKRSVFDTLHKQGGKIVLFGTDFSACTFLHHVEEMHAVPYRFMKTLSGTIIDHGRSYEAAVQYYARPLDVPDEKDFNLIMPHLQKAGVLRDVHIGSGRIVLVSAEDLFAVTMKLLDSNPYALLRRPPKYEET